MTSVPPPGQQPDEQYPTEPYPAGQYPASQYPVAQQYGAAPYGYPPAGVAPSGYQYGYPQYVPARPTNALAVITLVLALVGLSIGAVITGHISLGQMARTGEQGRGLGLAGLIIGYLGCAFWVLFWLSFSIVPLLWAWIVGITMVSQGTPA